MELLTIFAVTFGTIVGSVIFCLAGFGIYVLYEFSGPLYNK